MTPLERLRALGLPRDETLERLLRGELSFPGEHAELNFEGPDHGISNLDPGFVPIAFVGNGDYYGLYRYPPLPGLPVVEFFHEQPSVEWVAPSLADWLRGDCRQPPEWESILPTEARVAPLGEDQLLRWLVEHCPAEELRHWEREWSCFWTAADGRYEDSLIDFGLEAYRRLNWPLHVAALESAAAWGPTELGAGARESRRWQEWAELHPPLGEVARMIVARLGESEADAIFEHWCADFGWTQALQHPELRRGRAELGEALVAALPRSANALLRHEFEEALERLDGPIVAELRRLREQHQRERSTIADANDWSDVK